MATRRRRTLPEVVIQFKIHGRNIGLEEARLRGANRGAVNARLRQYAGDSGDDEGAAASIGQRLDASST